MVIIGDKNRVEGRVATLRSIKVTIRHRVGHLCGLRHSCAEEWYSNTAKQDVVDKQEFEVVCHCQQQHEGPNKDHRGKVQKDCNPLITLVPR